jgi:hypothetical protein
MVFPGLVVELFCQMYETGRVGERFARENGGKRILLQSATRYNGWNELPPATLMRARETMMFSQTAAEVIGLATAIRGYWNTELPKRHPNYPVVSLGEDSGPPPPPEEARLRGLRCVIEPSAGPAGK